jgi:hypothetical protein
MEKESIILLASVISAFATVVLAYLTSRYVKLTYEMVDEIKKARNPIVIINFIKRMEGYNLTEIDMIISNKGLSPAIDINLRAAYETHLFRDDIIKGNMELKIFQLNELPIFKTGITYLAPGDDIRDNIGKIENKDIRESPLVRIGYNYKTETGETIYRNIMLDLRYLAKEE